MKGLVIAIALVVACAGTAFVCEGTAVGEKDVSAAARAFSRAQEAELQGDYDRAAHLYELADRIAPAPEALRSAAKARYAARDNALAASHAEALLRRYPTDVVSRTVASKLLEKLAPKLGRQRVACVPACSMTVDGHAVGLDAAEQHVFYLEPGKHKLVAVFDDGRRARRSVRTLVDKSSSISIELPRRDDVLDTTLAPPVASRRVARVPQTVVRERARARNRGLSRAWFIGGAALTVGLGAASIWSGVDVLQSNAMYEENATIEAYNEGVRKQDRTNILIGATAAVGLTTIVLAFATDWSGGAQRAVTVGATADGARIGLRGAF